MKNNRRSNLTSEEKIELMAKEHARIKEEAKAYGIDIASNSDGWKSRVFNTPEELADYKVDESTTLILIQKHKEIPPELAERMLAVKHKREQLGLT
jgi:hypothetical protein